MSGLGKILSHVEAFLWRLSVIEHMRLLSGVVF